MKFLEGVKDSLKSVLDSKNTPEHHKQNPLEYVSIIQDLQRFRGSARASGDYYDFPNHTYFKILFHFYNGTDAISGGPSAKGEGGAPLDKSGAGLLHPTWLEVMSLQDYNFKLMNIRTAEDKLKKVQEDNKKSSNWLSRMEEQNAKAGVESAHGGHLKFLNSLWSNNTAWSYLVMNNEWDRAENLRSFIEMLSNINANTPWYFQNIKGLSEAVTREVVTSGEFLMKPDRNKITIECLEDAYDFRVSTLLDLYRSAVWSWEMKREMVPANLRKFDMTIIAFQMPIRGLTAPRKSMKLSETIMRNETKIIETNEGFAIIYDDGSGSQSKLTSYKAWEFHGCEFDYNSSKNSFDALSNELGTTLKPQIDILYDDCFEIRFNEFMGRHVTDLMGDANASSKKELKDVDLNRVAQYTDFEDADPSYLEQAIGGLLSWGKTKVKKLYLGNLTGLSLSKVRQQLGELDNLGATVNAIKQYTTKQFNGNRHRKLGDIYPEPKAEQFKRLGNLFTARTMANS